MLQLEHGPESFKLCVTALTLGRVALVGIPGEPFSAIGRTLKAAPGWDLVMPCCCTNGYDAYFPSMDAFQEGGYEARSSMFKSGIGEAIGDAGLALLASVAQPDA